MNGRLVRAITPEVPPLRLLLDGAELMAFAGDSVLVAVLTARGALRRHEFIDEARAGFCLMGACQDCWVWTRDGGRLRACSNEVREGLAAFLEKRQAVFLGR